MLAHAGTNDLVLAKRKGFVRLALLTGTPIVPVFAFGENDLFDQLPNPTGSWLRRFQDKTLAWLRFSVPVFVGRGFLGKFGFLPRRQPLLTVVGKPLEVAKTEAPTEDNIDRLHDDYMRELQALVQKHQSHYVAMVKKCTGRDVRVGPVRIVD